MNFKIQTAPYNPRKMSNDSKKALKKSIEEFSDISGITINQKTGNIVSGNHRWEELKEKHGELVLSNLFQDRYAINTEEGEFTGFIARVVNWPLKKEKQANVVANSPNVAGEWSSTLQDVLHEIALETDQLLMDDLRLSEMLIDLEVTDEDLDLASDNKRDKTKEEKENFELEDDEKPSHSEVRDIISTIKVTFPSEHSEEIMEKIILALAQLAYYEKITVN